MKIRIIPMGTSKDKRTQMQKELCRKFCNPSDAMFVQQWPTTSPMRSSMNGHMPHQVDIPNHTDELEALIRFLTGDAHEPTQGNVDKEANAPTQSAWKPAEDAILQTFFLAEGTAVVNRLEGRTESEIIERAAQLGLCDKCGWTTEEPDTLNQYYWPRHLNPAAFMPGRYMGGRSLRDKIPLAPWSKEEDDLVLSIYPREDILKRMLNRSEEEIEKRAVFLGVNQRKWEGAKASNAKPQHIETDVHDFSLKERFADFLNNAPAGSTFIVRK